MDFARVLDAVAAFLDARGVRHAIAGAFALHAYGRTRATSDLDLIVEAPGKAALLSFLDTLGYECLYVSPGVDKAAIRATFEKHGLLERFHELERALAGS